MLRYELMKWFTMFIFWSDLIAYIIWKCKMNYLGGKNLKFPFSGHNLISCIYFDSESKSV